MTDYNLYDGTPQITAAADTSGVNTGTEFYTTGPGWLTQLRFLQPGSGGSSTPRTMGLFRVDSPTTGTLVAGPFTSPAPTAGAWCAYTLAIPLALTTGQRYRVVVYHPGGLYPATGHFFDSNGAGANDRIAGVVTVPNLNNATGNLQGSFMYGAGLAMTGNAFNAAAYYADATITDTDPALAGHHYVVKATQDPPRWTGTQDSSRYAARQDAPRWEGVQDG